MDAFCYYLVRPVVLSTIHHLGREEKKKLLPASASPPSSFFFSSSSGSDCNLLCTFLEIFQKRDNVWVHVHLHLMVFSSLSMREALQSHGFIKEEGGGH